MSFLKSAAFDGLLKHALKVTAEAGIEAAMGQYRKRSHGNMNIESSEEYIEPVTQGDMKVFKQMNNKQFSDLNDILVETRKRANVLAEIRKEQDEMEDMLNDLFESSNRVSNVQRASANKSKQLRTISRNITPVSKKQVSHNTGIFSTKASVIEEEEYLDLGMDLLESSFAEESGNLYDDLSLDIEDIEEIQDIEEDDTDDYLPAPVKIAPKRSMFDM